MTLRCRLLLAALLCTSPAAPAKRPLPEQTAVSRMTPMQLAARFDRTCAQWKIAGLCPTWPRIRLRVFMYVPVAYVETTRTPGESTVRSPALLPLLADARARGYGDSITQSRSLADHTAEAHVYTLPDRLILSAGLGPLNMVCTPTDARFIDARGPAETASLLARATCGSALDVVRGEMTRALAGAFDSALSEALCTPRPAYVSEYDVPNWRTGCGDETIAKLMLANQVTCTAENVADFMNLGRPLGSLIGADACIGLWGALFPRQMRERGLTPVAASAKTAYRAMSLARASFGALPFPLGLDGLMQQVHPAPSQCFPPGAPVLQMEARGTKVSPTGVYGWVYWRPVTCCVPRAGAGGCVL